jgi:hypothetical protein
VRRAAARSRFRRAHAVRRAARVLRQHLRPSVPAALTRSAHRGAESDELVRGGRMDADRRVEDRGRRARLRRDSEALHDLVARRGSCARRSRRHVPGVARRRVLASIARATGACSCRSARLRPREAARLEAVTRSVDALAERSAGAVAVVLSRRAAEARHRRADLTVRTATAGLVAPALSARARHALVGLRVARRSRRTALVAADLLRGAALVAVQTLATALAALVAAGRRVEPAAEVEARDAAVEIAAARVATHVLGLAARAHVRPGVDAVIAGGAARSARACREAGTATKTDGVVQTALVLRATSDVAAPDRTALTQLARGVADIDAHEVRDAARDDGGDLADPPERPEGRAPCRRAEDARGCDATARRPTCGALPARLRIAVVPGHAGVTAGDRDPTNRVTASGRWRSAARVRRAVGVREESGERRLHVSRERGPWQWRAVCHHERREIEIREARGVRGSSVDERDEEPFAHRGTRAAHAGDERSVHRVDIGVLARAGVRRASCARASHRRAGSRSSSTTSPRYEARTSVPARVSVRSSFAPSR